MISRLFPTESFDIPAPMAASLSMLRQISGGEKKGGIFRPPAQTRPIMHCAVFATVSFFSLVFKIHASRSWLFHEFLCKGNQMAICLKFVKNALRISLPPSFLTGPLKPLQNKKGQKNLGYPTKKQSFYKEKDCIFVGYPNFFLALLILKRL